MATRNGWWRRGIAGLVLAACAIAPLGCGDSGDDAANSGAATAPAKESATNNNAAPAASATGAAAPAARSTPASAPGTAAAAVAPYLTPDIVAAAIFHPQRALGASLLKQFPEELTGGMLQQVQKETKLDPKSIERVVVLVPSDVDDENVPTGVLTFNRDVSDAELAAALDFMEGAEKKQHAGKIYYLPPLRESYDFGPKPPVPVEPPAPDAAPEDLDRESEAADPGEEAEVPADDEPEFLFPEPKKVMVPSGPAYFRPDARTLVLGTEARVKTILEGKPADTHLAKLLAGVSADQDLIVAASAKGHEEQVAKLKEGLAEGAGAMLPLPVQMAVAASEGVVAVVLTVDLSGPTMLGLTLEGKDDQTAEQLFAMADNGRKGLVEGYPQLREMLSQPGTAPAGVSEADVKDALDMGGKFVAAISVAQDGPRVVLELKRPEGLDEFVKAKSTAAILALRDRARQANHKSNIRQVAIAMHNYYEVYKWLPPQAPNHRKEAVRQTSYRVYLCQFLDEEALYREYRFEEPWESEHNKQFLARMPAVFADPAKPDATDGKTRIVVVTGPGTAFESYYREGQDLARGTRFQDITDGLHNTIMAVVVPEEKAVPWTKPEDFVFDPKEPFKGLGGKMPAEGLLVVACDTRVHLLPPDTTPEMFSALCTRSGGELVTFGADGAPRAFEPAPADTPGDLDKPNDGGPVAAPPDFSKPAVPE
ncbi:MAG: DUF1559 domain-containing protein [Planctomycetales bacterium]